MTTTPRATNTVPPIPRSLFRVGVTGHRPDRLRGIAPRLLSSNLRSVLLTIADTAQQSEAGVRLVLITSLAEGADRIAADIALELGYALHVPLPMPAAEYEQDFGDAESVSAFRKLLSTAERIMILPSPSGMKDRSHCYAAASNVVLSQCDVLLAVSDGKPSAGRGGTAETLSIAQDRGLPVLQIAAINDGEISFGDEALPLEALGALVARTLRPRGALMEQLKTYRHEKWPSHFTAAAYVLLRFFAEHRVRKPPSPNPDCAVDQIHTPQLRSYFAWADTLAMYYGERSRSASLRLQTLATLGVIAALLNIFPANGFLTSRFLSSVEAIALVWLLVSVVHSRRGHWHGRWLRYRSIAEQLRCVDLLSKLGLSAVHAGRQPQEGYCSEAMLMPWFVQRIEAEHGLLDATIDRDFLLKRLEQLNTVLAQQISFHATSSQRYRAAEDTLHRCGMLLFWAAATLSIYDLFHAFDWMPALLEQWLVHHRLSEMSLSATAAILPALGAAAAAIAAQGEYKRLAERSLDLSTSLEQIRLNLKQIGGIELSYSSISASYVSAVQVLSNDVRDWSDILASRPPSLPI